MKRRKKDDLRWLQVRGPLRSGAANRLRRSKLSVNLFIKSLRGKHKLKTWDCFVKGIIAISAGASVVRSCLLTPRLLADRLTSRRPGESGPRHPAARSSLRSRSLVRRPGGTPALRACFRSLMSPSIGIS